MAFGGCYQLNWGGGGGGEHGGGEEVGAVSGGARVRGHGRVK